jgi:cytidine deaminase
MPIITNQMLIQKAKTLAGRKKASENFEYGSVGCVLLTDKNSVYRGVSIDTACSMGFCAEHAAIAAMLTHGEKKIKKIVAVSDKGSVRYPCGRCREFMFQLNEDSKTDIEVITGEHESFLLRELLPKPYRDNR